MQEIVIPKTVHMLAWAALRKKVPNVPSHCHTKRRMGARRTKVFEQKVGVIPKDGWTWPHALTLGTFLHD